MDKIFQSMDVAVFAIVGAIAFGLGMWGYWECSTTFAVDAAGKIIMEGGKPKPYYHPDAPCHLNHWWQMALATLNLVRSGGDFSLTRVPPDPWQLYIAQLAIPAIAIVAGLRLIYNKFRRDFHIMMAGRQRDHIIVCGLDTTAMQIVQNLHDAKKDSGLVVIDPTGKEINAATCEKLGIPVIVGDARNERILAVAGLRRARSVVVATGDDTTNIEISLRLRDIYEAQPPKQNQRITIFTEIDNDWLFAKFHGQQNSSLGSTDVEIRLFNTYENGARLLIQDLPLPVAPELAAGALVVVGFGKMGRSVALQFLRAAPTALGQKMRIIVIDRAVEEAKQAIAANTPAAHEFADFEFVAADLVADKAEAWATIGDKLADEPLLAVVTCLAEDFDNLFVGMEMRRLLDAHDQYHVPIYVRLQHHNRLGRYAASTEVMVPIADRLKGFGTLEILLSREILVDAAIDKLARAWHEEYRKTLPPERRDAPANRPWPELPEFYKMSSRRACDHLPIKLAQAGLRMEQVAFATAVDLNALQSKEPIVTELTVDEIDLVARLEHRRWLIERRLLGWRHGPKRSETKRINPLLVEWDRLPDAEKAQRRKEAADLPVMLAGAGYVLRRVHLVRAYGDWLPSASAMMDEAERHKGQRHNVVVADVEHPEGFAIAERALKLSHVSLWLASREDPLALARSFQGEREQRFKELLARADGWTRCDHLVASLDVHPLRPTDAPPLRAVGQA
jgi:Trk K+ transport system NAD-binding subunit